MTSCCWDGLGLPLPLARRLDGCDCWCGGRARGVTAGAGGAAGASGIVEVDPE